MERRTERSDATPTSAPIDARTSLALWLRAGRAHRGMSLDDVSKVTKIQPRILERLEAGKLDGLPADVFVRGFVRSFARCVGLEEAEALRRYAACGLPSAFPAALLPVAAAVPAATAASSIVVAGEPAAIAGAGPQEITSTARGLVEAMAELVPASAARTAPRRPITEASGEAPRRLATGSLVDVIDLAAGSLPDLPAAATAVAIEPATIAVTVATIEPAEPVAAVQPSQASRKKRRRGKRDKRASGSGAPVRESFAMGTPVVAVPVVPTIPSDATIANPRLVNPVNPAPAANPADAAVTRAVGAADALPDAAAPSNPLDAASGSDAPREAIGPDIHEPIATATWAPKMPAVTASVPWRRPAYAAAAGTSVLVPSLIIDDADPDSAERMLEERAEKQAPRRSFLPPILLDREDRSTRQGGLTLAVIILLIAATLTLSYLMRRPSASGDGMTWVAVPASDLG